MKKLRRDKRVFNLNSAKTAGVIYTAKEESEWLHNKEFIEFLRGMGIKLTVLVYLENKNLKFYYSQLSKVNFFSVEDLNWSQVPKSGFIYKFVEKEYDLLIDLDVEPNFPTSCITALSRAHFKVGLKNNIHDYYDLMIDLGNFKNQEEYFKQVKHYLSIINNYQ